MSMANNEKQVPYLFIGAQDRYVPFHGSEVGFPSSEVGLNVFPYIKVGSSFNVGANDRGHGNPASLVVSGQTTTFTSATQTNPNARGIHFMLNVTAVPGGDTVQPVIQGLFGGFDYDLLVGPTINATGQYVIQMYPALVEIPNLVASNVLPYEYRLQVRHSGAGSFSYTLLQNLMV